jgi:SAM-dependent methyltransferase
MTVREDRMRLRQMLNGYQVSQALHVAATLGVPDLLAGGPRTRDELSTLTGTHPDALYRLLRALASVGVLREEDGRRFSSTPLGDGLRTDAPQSLAGMAESIGQPYRWQPWAELLHSVRTGENAFRHVHGMDVWEYRRLHPAEGAAFDRAMTANTRGVDEAVLAVYDFSRFGTVVDVGGGHGALLGAILAQHPAMRGVLFDQPQVAAGARVALVAAGVGERCQVVGGSFFEALPEGGDAYVMKSIIHDWEDAESIAILRRCAEVLRPGSAVLLIERDLPGPNQGMESKLSDLNMLVLPGGRERTLAEYQALFEAAGLRFVGATPTDVGVSIIEAAAA